MVAAEPEPSAPRGKDKLVINHLHFIKHDEAKGLDNFNTMRELQLAVLHVLSQVTLAALDELVHDLVGVLHGKIPKSHEPSVRGHLSSALPVQVCARKPALLLVLSTCPDSKLASHEVINRGQAQYDPAFVDADVLSLAW